MFEFSNSLKQILLSTIIYLIGIYIGDLISFYFYLDRPYLQLESFFSEKSKTFCKILNGSISVFFWEVISDFLRFLLFGVWAILGVSFILLKFFNLKIIKDSISIFNYKDTWLEKSHSNISIFFVCLILIVPILYRFIFSSFYGFYCFL
jgi:hypothetical protein